MLLHHVDDLLEIRGVHGVVLPWGEYILKNKNNMHILVLRWEVPYKLFLLCL